MATITRTLRASELKKSGPSAEGTILSFLSGDDEVKFTIRREHLPELLARPQDDATILGFISGSNRDQMVVRVKAFSVMAATTLVAGLVDLQ